MWTVESMMHRHLIKHYSFIIKTDQKCTLLLIVNHN